MEYDWKIYPKVGVGQIRFGMKKADVSALSAVYGEIESEREMHMPDSIIEETLALLGDTISAADKEAFLAGIRETYTGNSIEVRKFGRGHLILEYDQNGLVEVQADSHCYCLNIDGVYVFRTSAERTLQRMEEKNGLPGRCLATEIVFDALAISLNSFCVVEADRIVRILQDTDESFAKRSVTLRPDVHETNV